MTPELKAALKQEVEEAGIKSVLISVSQIFEALSCETDGAQSFEYRTAFEELDKLSDIFTFPEMESDS
jgi:hypothetical protein